MILPKRIQKLLRSTTLRGGSLSIFDQAIISATSFLSTVLIGRLCGREELGIYFAIFNLILFARNIQQQLITGPYTVLVHHQEMERAPAYRGSTILLQIAYMVLMAIATLATSHFLAPESRLSPPFVIASIFVLFLPLVLFRDLIRHFELARLNFIAVLAIDATVGIVQVGGLIIGSQFQYISTGLANALAGLGSIVAVIAWYYWCKPPLQLNVAETTSDWLKTWTIGKWGMASHLIGSSTPYILPWIAVLAKGNDETGVLAACTTLIGLSNVFVLGIDNYLMVRASAVYSQGGKPALRSILWNFAMIYLVGLGFFCICVALMGRHAMEFVYGSGYGNAQPVMTALALSVLCRAIGMIASIGVIVLQHPKVNLISDLISLSVTMFVTYLTVDSHGIFGIAMATLSGAMMASISRVSVFLMLMHRLEKDDLQIRETIAGSVRAVS